MEKTKIYKYGMLERGFSIGCQPKKGLVRWEDTDRFLTGFWSVLEYNRLLTPDEVADYELEYIGETTEMSMNF